MAPSSIQRRRQRGAVLLLLVAVLGLGIATVAIKVFSKPLSDAQHELATIDELNKAREALLGYALRTGRLPRPATSLTDGRERPAPCTGTAECTGLLPWVTLGVSGLDAWNKRLRYSVTPALSARGFSVINTIADKRVLTRDGKGQLQFLQGQSACAIAAQCLPAVIFSSGRRNLGISAQGIPMANATVGNIDEQSNDQSDNDFVSRPATLQTDTPGGEFDDIVSWITLAQLYQQMARAGTLQTRP